MDKIIEKIQALECMKVIAKKHGFLEIKVEIENEIDLLILELSNMVKKAEDFQKEHLND